MKTETTIRRARNAVGLILDGAIRHIESDYGPDDSSDRQPYIVDLFDAIDRELQDWDVGHAGARRRDLVDDMELLLGADSSDQHPDTAELMAELMALMPDGIAPSDVHAIMAALLDRHGLLP